MIDLLFDIFCGIWTIVGSLIGTVSIVVLLICLIAILRGC